jgi:hypothetical protein
MVQLERHRILRAGYAAPEQDWRGQKRAGGFDEAAAR